MRKACTVAIRMIGIGAAAMLTLLGVTAHANPYDLDGNRNQAVSVSVNYTFTLPPDAGADAADGASERGRRQAYEMAGRECANLLETIAATCSLGSINVSSQPQRGYGQAPEGINIRASANFKITPKAQTAPERSPPQR